MHSSTLPSRNRQRNETLFFPCSLAIEANPVIPSASPKEEYSSNRPLRSFACFKHCSAISNCNYKIQVPPTASIWIHSVLLQQFPAPSLVFQAVLPVQICSQGL
nr:hypothetical protein Iba_chr03dCG0290 [Ipomoea batatas]GMC77631.1 hypothetical protein Iba_chr03fCG0340 [Ipomoea batatas]GMC77632.1 hypothetical protein Iba_chr03fCG0350 [Ipomoea batatas]